MSVPSSLPVSPAASAVLDLVSRYRLAPAAAVDNESRAWAGSVAPGASARVAWFASGGWALVRVAFGEVRETFAGPLAAGGVVEASSRYLAPGELPLGGGALPGNTLPGLSWRISAVAPRSRTRVAAVRDGFVPLHDVVAFALALAPVVGAAAAAPGDLSVALGCWAPAALPPIPSPAAARAVLDWLFDPDVFGDVPVSPAVVAALRGEVGDFLAACADRVGA